MAKAVQLTRRREVNTTRRVFCVEPVCGKGVPPIPPYRGVEGVPFFPNISLDSGLEESSQKNTAEQDTTHLDVERVALGMTKTERQALLDRLALSLQESEADRDSSMWLHAVVRALQTRLGAGGASAYGAAVSKPYIAASKVFKPVADFIRLVGLCDLTVPQRQSALNYLAEMVVDDADGFAKYAQIPLGPKLVGQRQMNVYGIFDQAFPTYLKAGLARIVFRRLADSASWEGDRSAAS